MLRAFPPRPESERRVHHVPLTRPLLRRAGATALTAVLGAGLLTAGTAGGAQAATADDELTLAVTAAPATSYAAGVPVTWTYTATNEHATPLVPDPESALVAYLDTDALPEVTGGDCAFWGWDGDVWAAGIELDAPVEPGASLTCVVTYTPTAADVARAGAWAALTYQPFADGTWTAAHWAVLTPAGTPAAPTVTGTPVVGGTLTVAPWFWDPWQVPLTYQWLRDGTPIQGATGTTYRPTSADLGRAISIRVGASDLGVTWPSAATAAVAPGTLTPSTPVVSGTAAVGRTLTAKPGTWAPSGVALTYQWLRSGTAIRGATASTYTLTAADRGATLSVRVSGARAGYTTATRTSGATATVKPGTITVTTATKVSGTARVGARLTAVAPRLSVTGTRTTYQWLREGRAISGATKPTYTLTKSDKGKRVSVRATVTRSGFTTVTSTSARTSAVKAG